MSKECDQFESPSGLSPVLRYRRALPIWAQFIATLTIFAAGYVVGTMTTTKSIHDRMEGYRSNAPIFSEDIVSRLKLRLSLDEIQTGQVREIIERGHERLLDARRSRKGSMQMHQEFDLMVSEISDVLDEQQSTRWQVIANTVRLRFLPPLPSNG